MSNPSFKVWKVRQYCAFWIASKVVTADEIAASVGIEPDKTSVRGSKSQTPRVVPVEHSWAIVSRHGRLEEQMTELLNRIAPAAPAVRRLVDRGDVEAGLTMYRHFDDPDGGYNAMNWWLEPEQVALLASMRADIGADEYLDNFEPSSYYQEP